MSRVRIVVVDMEGTDAAAMDAAFRNFAGGWSPVLIGETSLAGIAAAAAPLRPLTAGEPVAAPKARAIAAPRKAPDVPEAAKKPTMSGAVRELLAAGPQSNGGLLRELAKRGFATDSKRLTVLLCGLRAKNEIYKDDTDLTWRRSERA